MSSKVYFSKKTNGDLIKDLSALFDAVAGDVISTNDSVAVKMHFGEPGNNAYLKPHFVKPIIDKIKSLKAIPYLTDANTLYKGARSDSKSHLESAKKHGYSKITMGAEIVIADGPDARDIEKIAVDLKHFKELSIAAAGVRCDSFIALSHFKGHDCTGFGGAIKNVGMGLGSRAGKQRMHSDVRPRVNKKICLGDGDCARWCPVNAIRIVEGKAEIDEERCIGCAECVAACRTGAIGISWFGNPDSVQEKMAEYAYGVLLDKKNKAVFFNFLVEISPNCDCYPRNEAPICADIGVLASKDIVAIDQASLDMVNRIGTGDKGKGMREEGKDKFRALYPDIDDTVQLKYAEQIGLGSREYELIEL